MSKLLAVACLAAGAAVGTVFIAPACSQQTPPATPATQAATPSEKMHAAMNRMSTAMASMKMTGDTDQDFAMMMAEHHQGAIEMAEIEVQSGKDEHLKAMAKKMIEAQRAEIAELRKHSSMTH